LLLTEHLEERTLLTASGRNEVAEAVLAARRFDPGAVEALKAKPAPKPNITATVTAGPGASGVVTISGKTYPKAKVTLQIVSTGASQPVVKASTKGLYQVTFTVGFGSTKVQLSATAPGKKATSTTLTVSRPDTVPPVVTLGTLSPGPLAAAEETITGKVSDAVSGPASLTASVNGGAPQPVSLLSDGSFAFTTTLKLDGSNDGPDSVRLVATDHAGNSNTSAPTVFPFALETRGPSLTVPAPPPSTATNLTITGHAADALSGIAMVMASLNGATAVPLTVSAAGDFSFTTTLDLGGTNDGTNTVQFMAVNGAGKITTQSVSFTLETHGPALTIQSPSNGTVSATNVTVTGTTSDAVSGITTLTAQLDSTPAVPVTVSSSGSFSYTTNLTLGGVDDGMHTVTLTATNGVGKTTTKSVSFNLQSVPPTSGLTLVVAAPVSAAAVSTNGRLIGTVTETGTAVASAQYALDSSAFAPLTLDASGGFDVPLAATALDAGPHSLTVKATDTGGGAQQQTVNFTVAPNSFVIDASGTAGWGEATATDIHLEERDSLLVEYTTLVDLNPVAQGTRTISFQVAPRFDHTDTTAIAGDRLAVALVDPANPGNVLLPGDQAGAPLFELDKTGAAGFPSGLVSFDGTTVTIDVTSATALTMGELVFQLLNGDTDNGTAVDIKNLADTVNPTGTSSPTMPALTPGAPGAALSLSSLSA
jgi:hypothetical protein